jgi:UDP-2,3-diacylglucosamine pyrophosphatase LpxH
MTDYNELRTWATVRELEYIEAIEKQGTMAKASKALGLNKGRISDAMMSLKRRAALMGHSPKHGMTKTVPDGFIVKGVSSLYDRDGKLSSQWVKSTVDQARQAELMKAAVAALSEEVRALAPITQAPHKTESDLLTVYPLGDPHVGLRAWGKECGDDFDLKIAEQLTLAAVDRLVQASPASEQAIILPLGDVFHANDQTNQTPAHRHQLDVDSRHVHVLQIGIKTFRHAVIRALEKHAKVTVRFVTGNHDPESVWALAFTIAAYFETDTRVSVDLSPAAHWYFRFGKVLLGATHGDKSRAEQLPGVMACDKAEDWGLTKHRHWLCGHVHHSSVKEFPGVTVETFRTLAAADAYAAGHGYRAGRDMRALVFHREHGEIERHRVDVGMIQP